MRTYGLNFVSEGYDRLKLGVGRRQILPREQNMAQKIETNGDGGEWSTCLIELVKQSQPKELPKSILVDTNRFQFHESPITRKSGLIYHSLWAIYFRQTE